MGFGHGSELDSAPATAPAGWVVFGSYIPRQVLSRELLEHISPSVPKPALLAVEWKTLCLGQVLLVLLPGGRLHPLAIRLSP